MAEAEAEAVSYSWSSAELTQVVYPVKESGLRLECYVDARQNVDRKSISGGCGMVGGFCLKSWCRWGSTQYYSTPSTFLIGGAPGYEKNCHLDKR